MINFFELQKQYTEWLDHNFPNSTAQDQMTGVFEEAGELAHHILKGKQGIRGDCDFHEDEAKDAVGDLIIFLMGFCSRKKWDLNDIVSTTWEKVKMRDWVKFPFNGIDK